MITQFTTLVLGAGASIPFGFPSGLDLLNKVVGNLTQRDSTGFVSMTNLRFKPEEVESFCQALRFSGTRSVDKFLERRRDFLKIGKAAIAQALVPYEAQEELFHPGKDDVNWYKHLWAKMDCDFSQFGKNKLAVITFNYDRSLEHFLFTALKNYHGRTEEECARLLNAMAIIHVHGQLGFLPWQGKPPANDYGRSNLREVAEAIKIISEDVDQTAEFRMARQMIAQSERIYFLGFGYDENNLRRLGIGAMKGIPGRTIRGSARDMTEAEKEDVRERTSGLISFPRPGNNFDALSFLRNEAELS